MWCAVVDREGQLLLDKATDTGGTPAAPAGSDAWRGSIEIFIAKAYSAVAFSSGDQAFDQDAWTSVTNRWAGFGGSEEHRYECRCRFTFRDRRLERISVAYRFRPRQ
jgi:uncharacterized protein GlcG (DUF336 family)